MIAVIALFVALGGTGYAAIALPKNSVGKKQIKKNAVTSKKSKNASLKAADLKAGVIPPGFSGSAAGGDLAGTYPNPTIADGKVTAAKIAAGAVGSAQLANGSVTAADVAIARGHADDRPRHGRGRGLLRCDYLHRLEARRLDRHARGHAHARHRLPVRASGARQRRGRRCPDLQHLERQRRTPIRCR